MTGATASPGSTERSRTSQAPVLEVDELTVRFAVITGGGPEGSPADIEAGNSPGGRTFADTPPNYVDLGETLGFVLKGKPATADRIAYGDALDFTPGTSADIVVNNSLTNLPDGGLTAYLGAVLHQLGAAAFALPGIAVMASWPPGTSAAAP